MSVPFVPHGFHDGENLDLEKLNDNLESIARFTQRSLDARYTYSTHRIDLDTETDASAAVLRQIPIRRPGANNGVEIVGVELVIYAASGVTWTLSCSDTTWPSLSLATAGATTEAYASSGVPVSVPDSTTDLVFTLSASAASTIVRGYVVVHLRCDRGNQGTSHAGYFPTIMTSATTGVGAALDAELAALEAAVERDTANDVDLRCEAFTARDLAAGSSVVFRLPSGARRKMHARVYVVAPVGCTGAVNVDGTSASVAGTGVTNRVTASATLSGTTNDDPMDSTDDTVVTLSATGAGTAQLIYALVWWS